MFQTFKPKIKLFLIVAVMSAVLAVGGVLLLQAVLRPSSHTPAPAQAPVPSPQPQMPDTEGWQTYRNEEFGFEVKYPQGEAKEYKDWSESQNNFSAVAQVNFEECYIAFYGVPFGIEDENVEIEIQKDQVFINNTEIERTFWLFPNRPGFAFLNLDYFDGSYPKFIIYHSVESECLDITNQILSTFRFVE